MESSDFRGVVKNMETSRYNEHDEAPISLDRASSKRKIRELIVSWQSQICTNRTMMLHNERVSVFLTGKQYFSFTMEIVFCIAYTQKNDDSHVSCEFQRKRS